MRLVPALVAALVVAAGSMASACGSDSGEGRTPGHLAIGAAVRRAACPSAGPGASPYRGALVLLRGDGHRVRVRTDSSGRGRGSLGPGRYRLVPPLPGSSVRLELDGHPVSPTGNPYPIRITAGGTANVVAVIMLRRGECTSGGAGA
jgi:hypothetical protein